MNARLTKSLEEYNKSRSRLWAQIEILPKNGDDCDCETDTESVELTDADTNKEFCLECGGYVGW